MKALISFLIICFVFTSCNKKKHFAGPNSYDDSFENYAVADDMIAEADDKFWSFFQLTKAENTHTIDTLIKHSGNKSFKLEAIASPASDVSKASVSKQNMAFWEKETVHLSAWYYLEGTGTAQWLFIMDLEEQTAIGAGPGIRLAIVDGALRVEHKYFNDDIIQAGAPLLFPRDQWVQVELEVKLSQKKKGYVKVWQNGTLIIDQDKWRTLPKDFLYNQQGTKGMYSSIEFGITANTKDHNTVLYVDDVSAKRVD